MGESFHYTMGYKEVVLYVVDAHYNSLGEATVIITHNIHFGEKNKKQLVNTP